MVRISSILGFGLPLATLAAPTNSKSSRPIEDKPWIIEDIFAFEAKETSLAPSYIGFTFTDVNKGLELQTKCSIVALAGSGASIMSNYYAPCANSTVGFIFSGTNLKLQRRYRDDEVGQPPHNYITAFGNANTTFAEKFDSCGTAKTLKKLKIPITGLIA